MLLRAIDSGIRAGKSIRRQFDADFDADSVKRAAHFTL
jgi:hypothetical protein